MNSKNSVQTNDDQSSEEQEFWTLSGKKPFFDVILAPSHLYPSYRLKIPAKMRSLLPSLTIPVVLKYQGKEWDLKYIGKKAKCFDRDWRKFADDNNLNIGDACVFELVESDSEKLIFRTQILSGKIPPEMIPKLVPGECVERPIDIE